MKGTRPTTTYWHLSADTLYIKLDPRYAATPIHHYEFCSWQLDQQFIDFLSHKTWWHEAMRADLDAILAYLQDWGW